MCVCVGGGCGFHSQFRKRARPLATAGRLQTHRMHFYEGEADVLAAASGCWRARR